MTWKPSKIGTFIVALNYTRFDFGEIHAHEFDKKLMEQEQHNQVVTKLHTILRPFLLRRTKQSVEIELPKKEEKIVYTPLSSIQQTYYQAFLDGTIEKHLSDFAMKQIRTRGNSLQNKLMQLRKVCNHPYLFDWPQNTNGDDIVDENIIYSSGKLVTIDRILQRMKKEDHKVLLFSQMTSVLDILGAYMEFKKYKFRRIDGSTPQAVRNQNITDFNSDESIFVFLLSTRAAGLGINLTAADTVIFYDHDWVITHFTN